MQTYSHFLITAILNDGLKSRGLPVHTKALLLGSFAPDLPLLLLTLGFLVKRSWSGLSAADDPICGPHFNKLYFHNPFWIAGHNLFHAPIHAGLMVCSGYYLGLRRPNKRAAALFWFAVACGFHTLIDIFTHTTDGPLFFFPFNWQYRFQSPVSYWDHHRGGRVFALLERLLNLIILIYFAATWLVHRKPLKDRGMI